MTSWKINDTWKGMGKWNKISFSLLWVWVMLLIFSPYLIEGNTTGDLSGSVGIYDNREVIENMNFAAKFVYYVGDINCHQLSHRSYTYSTRKKIILTLPIIIAALLPIGLDGTIQLLTDYESTNNRRMITGLIAGSITGIAIKIISDSMDKKYTTTEFFYHKRDNSLNYQELPCNNYHKDGLDCIFFDMQKWL